MRCHLIVPDLILPGEYSSEACAGLSLPALETFLGKGDTRSAPAEGYEAWLCEVHGIQKQQDWPLAPVTQMADGGIVGDDYWLRADPVHLRVDRDRLVLADSSAFELSQAEANELTGTLNAHFIADGVVFYPFRPDRWYVRQALPPKLQTTSLCDAVGKNIDTLLPRGVDGRRFVGMCNEVQMLLSSHPLNEAREAAGDLAVNSVWFWGGGKLPDAVRQPFSQVWASEHVAYSLGLASGAPTSALPESGIAWLALPACAGEGAVVLGQLRTAAKYGDTYRWREILMQLEHGWFVPLLAALRPKRLERLTITAFGAGRRHSATIRPGDLWKFWRRGAPLSALASA